MGMGHWALGIGNGQGRGGSRGEACSIIPPCPFVPLSPCPPLPTSIQEAGKNNRR